MRQLQFICFSCRWCFTCFKHHVFPSSPWADHPQRSHRQTVCISANASAPRTVVTQKALAFKVKLLALHQQSRDRNTFALLTAILVAIVGSFCHNGAFLNDKTHTLTSANQAFVFCPIALINIVLQILQLVFSPSTGFIKTTLFQQTNGYVTSIDQATIFWPVALFNIPLQILTIQIHRHGEVRRGRKGGGEGS